MRRLTATLGLVFIACSFGPVSAAAPGFSDGLCPEATQYVLVAGKLRKDDPPQRIYDAAAATTEAYQRCSREKLSNGLTDEMHYANTRAASFAVLSARALVAMNRLEDARRELAQWRPLAQMVVDWRSGAKVGAQGHAPTGEVQQDVAVATRGDHRESRYRESAKEIVAAIDADLAQIDATLRERPRPQGVKPADSPTAPAPTSPPARR